MVFSFQAAFLSLNLHALAEQLEKIDLAQRLFIEAHLLPPELVCFIFLIVRLSCISLQHYNVICVFEITNRQTTLENAFYFLFLRNQSFLVSIFPFVLIYVKKTNRCNIFRLQVFTLSFALELCASAVLNGFFNSE